MQICNVFGLKPESTQFIAFGNGFVTFKPDVPFFGEGIVKYPSRATGELVNALGLSPAKQDRKGNHNIKIGFTEPRKDGESNAKIANIIEHGKSGQPPRPFLKPAKSATRKSCIEVMKSRLEQELGRI